MRAFTSQGVLVSVLMASSIATGTPDSASQASVDRAAVVLTAVRGALGGEARIAGVKTFIANGRSRQVRGDNLIPIEFEIAAELPDRYLRRDEFPAQDNGPATIGFNLDALVQQPVAPPPAARAGAPPPTPEQLGAIAHARVISVKQDFARLTLGMFAASFSSFPLSFSYVGQAEAPEGTADVLDAEGPANFRARFFVSSETHLPIMLTWQAPAAPAGRRGGPSPTAPPPTAPPPLAEQRMYFADYRNVDGLQLPFRIRRGAGAETTEETTFDRYRINARIDPKRFQAADSR